MSTIHDALKKVQDDMQPQDVSAEKTPEPEKPYNPFNAPPPLPEKKIAEENPEPPKKNSKKITNIIFIVIILCGLGYSIFSLVTRFNFHQLKQFKASIFHTQIQQSKQAQPAVATPKGGIRIQGIMAMGSRHVALINNDIYEVGDTVEEKRIKLITKNEVTIVDDAGVEKTLEISK